MLNHRQRSIRPASISPLALMVLALAGWTSAVEAQVIPSIDGFTTEVNQVGEVVEIDGGQVSADRVNLFHSFEQFDLPASGVANFVTTAEIQHILGRVVGGSASSIDGLIQVTGSNADLFLINPAGIIFGENARLDVAGDFTATTAGAIEFESGWLDVLGEVNGSALTGEPIAFDFSGLDSGAIVNLGELTVAGDSSLNLFGGTVVNAGTVSGGNVSLTAVGGGQTLQLSAAGNVLGLEVATDRVAGLGIVPIALPELLTGGHVTAAGSLTIGEDGIVRLSSVPLETGDSVITGAIDVSGELGGVVQVLGDRVLLAGATIEASGVLAGGSVFLGGVLVGGVTLPTAMTTVVDAESVVNANAIASGDGGEVIVWADDTAGFWGEITARGGALTGNGGFVETSGAGSLVFRGGVDLAAPQGLVGSLLLDPTNITISSALSNPAELQTINPFAIAAADYSSQDVTINSGFLEEITGNVTLEATNDITLTSDLTFSGTGSITFKADADQSGAGAFTGSRITAPGRNLEITGHGVSSIYLNTDSYGGVPGSINVHSTEGIDISSLNTGAGNQAGSITLEAVGLVDLGYITSGGNISITSDGMIQLEDGISGADIVTIRSHQDSIKISSSSAFSPGIYGNVVTVEANDNIELYGNLTSATDGIVLRSSHGNIIGLSSTIAGNSLNRNTEVDAFGDIRLGSVVNNNQSSATSILSILSQSGSIYLADDVNSYPSLHESSAVDIQAATNIEIMGRIASFSGSGSASGQPGSISLRSTNGSVSVAHEIDSSSLIQAAEVTVEAYGDINLAQIISGGAAQIHGANVTINSSHGSVGLDGVLTAGDDDAGEISISALNDVHIRGATPLFGGSQFGLDSTSNSTPQSIAGDIYLNTISGQVIASQTINSYSSYGTAGSVAIASGAGLNLQNVASYGNIASGNLTITSQGAIDAAAITTKASAGPSGNITINGTSIATGNVSSLAGTGSGNITISGTQTVNVGNIASSTNTGSSGSVTVGGTGNVTTGNITSSTSGSGNSGNITVESTEGSVTTGDVTTSSAGGSSGNIDFSALIDIITGNLTSSAGQSSGDITLNAGRDINTGNITSAAVDGDSGDINLTAGRDITAGDITSSSVNGQSGDIGLVAGGNINTGTITTQDGQISIDANGTIATGDLISDNAALINGEILNPEIVTEPPPSTLTEQRDAAISTIQADSSLNPNTLTTPSVTTSTTSVSGATSDTAIINETQADTSVLAGLSSGFLSLQTSNISLGDIIEFDDNRTNEYTQHFGGDGSLTGSVAATREAMAKIEEQTGIRTGVVYVSLRDTAIDLSMITAADAPLTMTIPVDRATLLDTVAAYRNSLINARYRLMGRHNDYAAQLYDWLIRPIATDLEARGIDTLMLSLDVGLRGLPIAALYDGEQYLIENYSLSLIPSMGLIDTRYQPLDATAPMLAMGASEFTALAPLPAVPAELDTLVNHRRNGEIVLNADFTRRNIIADRDRTPYPIVHLATHGEFNEGSLSNSYIQLWDERIGLDQIRELGWHEPAVELLVLSACQTALGNAEAEMGFAGLAVAAGVKTAIASLWYVDDAATFMLMSELYHYLATAPIKAEALRSAQLALMRGQVRITDGMLYADGIEEPLPVPESLSSVAGHDFSNPYYWSGFTAIGAPW